MSRWRGFRWPSWPDARRYSCSGRSWPTIRLAAFWRGAIPRPAEAISPPSERGLQAGVKGAGPHRTERTRIRKRRTTIGEIGNGAGVEERSISRIEIVEDIIGTRVDLVRLVDLIGGVQVDRRIGWQLRR